MTAEAYQVAFSGIFKAVGKYYPQFDPKDCLQAVIVDYSDAQVQGLIQTVGQNKAFSVLKGCQLHWMRSDQCYVFLVGCASQRMSSFFLKPSEELFLWQKRKRMSLKCSTCYVEEPKCPNWMEL
ncbi:hypothetical protein ACROYT_G011573 [Oculina patagonica]